MKSQSIVLAVLFLLVFGAGFLVGRFAGGGTSLAGVAGTLEERGEARSNDDELNAQTQEQQTGTDSSLGMSGDITIRISDLPESQQTLLRSLGVEGDTLTITEEMYACAEGKLGSERIAQIRGGSAVSFGEGMSLVSCYQ